MIDVPLVRGLAKLMAQHELTAIYIREGDAFLALQRRAALAGGVAPTMVASVPAALPGPALHGSPAATESVEDKNLVPIVSPMIGTFYAASGRGDAPFVTVGTNVGENTAVCIVEAMKVFNEISAGVAGVVDRILVRNQQAVELGQPLMLVRARA